MSDERTKKLLKEKLDLEAQVTKLEKERIGQEMHAVAPVPNVDLNVVNEHNLNAFKTLKNPPDAVRFLLTSLCLLFGVKPIVPSSPQFKPNNPPVKADYVQPGKKLILQIDFMHRLKAFDYKAIPMETLDLLRDNYLANPLMTPDRMQKANPDGVGLVKWVIAVEALGRHHQNTLKYRDRMTAIDQEVKELKVKIQEKQAEIDKAG